MIAAGFIFTIFMITLGPIKTIPAFYVMTAEMDPKTMRGLALWGALYATGLSLLIAFVVAGVAEKWGISVDDLRIAGGVLLFAASFEMINSFNRPATQPAQAASKPRNLALSPLAIPTIVTPWGVVAILLFMGMAGENRTNVTTVLTVLIAIMILDYVGMLFARPIVKLVHVATFQVLGWIFAVLQAALAVDSIVTALQHLGIVRAQ